MADDKGASGYRNMCRCPFCDFMVRPASLNGKFRVKAEDGGSAGSIICPLCNTRYLEGVANQASDLVAFLSAAHQKLGFPNLTVEKLRRIVLFVAYEHHLINCDGERDETFQRYYEQVQEIGTQEMLSETERRAHGRHA